VPDSTTTSEKLFAARKAKLGKIEQAQQTAYPHRVLRSALASNGAKHVDDEPPPQVDVAGRVMSLRRMGKTSFAHLRDRSGNIQLFINEKVLGETSYTLMRDTLDVGDFVSAGGQLFRTRTQEPSIRVERITIAAKSLRPLPEKWHGLQDPELRLRQRYLDVLSNDDTRKRFESRALIISALRRTLDNQSFLEVETPTLQPVYGGGTAKPFVTRYASLGRDYYLRIADELYLKRLLVAGYERVYEICKNFRNEGIDGTHSPEFTMLEAYQAFADLDDMRSLTETLVVAAVEAVHGSTRAILNNRTVDFSPPWKRLTYRDALIMYASVDIEANDDNSELSAAATSKGIKTDPKWPRAKLLDELTKHLVEPNLIAPTFLERYPAETAPLAKRCDDDPCYVERFEPFVNGMEIGNAYAELNDPIDQRKRLEAQAATRDNEEAMPMDEDFLLALEHGMPPAGGLGIGIDRLVMVVTDAPNIREAILFPQLRDRS
jgi:lysyl-tRNA synthetase class 2